MFCFEILNIFVGLVNEKIENNNFDNNFFPICFFHEQMVIIDHIFDFWTFMKQIKFFIESKININVLHTVNIYYYIIYFYDTYILFIYQVFYNCYINIY